jgi:1-deoxy-D-xylulose 5-phosphate reductoisomerase
MSKNIILFGATGSIGTSVLKILIKPTTSICLKGITCHQNIDNLIDISNRYKCDN